MNIFLMFRDVLSGDTTGIALWVCVHPISKGKADQLLATGVESHREELIQCIALHRIL
jgi:hypothetical protein